jgi:hypothetical protein
LSAQADCHDRVAGSVGGVDAPDGFVSIAVWGRLVWNGPMGKHALQWSSGKDGRKYMMIPRPSHTNTAAPARDGKVWQELRTDQVREGDLVAGRGTVYDVRQAEGDDDSVGLLFRQGGHSAERVKPVLEWGTGQQPLKVYGPSRPHLR